MSKASRSKGRRGESIAKRLLEDRDYIILADLTSGLTSEDLLAQSPEGKIYSIEVKNRKQINIGEFRKQVSSNAKKKKLAWYLMVKIEFTSSWLILRSDDRPTVWHEK